MSTYSLPGLLPETLDHYKDGERVGYSVENVFGGMDNYSNECEYVSTTMPSLLGGYVTVDTDGDNMYTYETIFEGVHDTYNSDFEKVGTTYESLFGGYVSDFDF